MSSIESKGQEIPAEEVKRIEMASAKASQGAGRLSMSRGALALHFYQLGAKAEWVRAHSSQPSGQLRWVKVTLDNLPNINKFIPIRWRDYNGHVNGTFGNRYLLKSLVQQRSYVEYLEESPLQPIKEPVVERETKDELGKCGGCKNLRIESLGKDEAGAPGSRVYCSKGHWEGLGNPEDAPPADDPWEDCEDFASTLIQQEAIPQSYVENRACLFAAWLEDNALKDGEHWYLFTDHRKNRWDEIDEDCVKYTLPMLYVMFSNAIPDHLSNEVGENKHDMLPYLGYGEKPSPGQPEGEIPEEIKKWLNEEAGEEYAIYWRNGAIAMYRHLQQQIMDGNDAYALLEQQYEHLQKTLAEVKEWINSHI